MDKAKNTRELDNQDSRLVSGTRIGLIKLTLFMAELNYEGSH